MKVPVFVSHPSALNESQKRIFDFILSELEVHLFEHRALGQSDYPTLLPLREVLSITRHCAGGIILGFRQFETESGIWKKGTDRESPEHILCFPYPMEPIGSWGHVCTRPSAHSFREQGVEGGIFDIGTSEIFVHNLPSEELTEKERSGLRQVFVRWSAKVRHRYYRDSEFENS